MSVATYVSEDGLFGPQWKESPLVVQTLYAPVQGNIRAKKWEWGRGVGGGSGLGSVVGDCWDSIGNVNEINT